MSVRGYRWNTGRQVETIHGKDGSVLTPPTQPKSVSRHVLCNCKCCIWPNTCSKSTWWWRTPVDKRKYFCLVIIQFVINCVLTSTVDILIFLCRHLSGTIDTCAVVTTYLTITAQKTAGTSRAKTKQQPGRLKTDNQTHRHTDNQIHNTHRKADI